MREKKKGFTLIEILAVLVILAILMVIAVPSIMKMSGRMKNRGLDSKLEAIKEAAVNYAQSHSNKIKDEILKENHATACTRSEARSFGGSENVYYAGEYVNRWCECANNASGDSDDCKFVFRTTVDALITEGAYKSEKESAKGECDVMDPSNNVRCLDCVIITVKLDDQYKSADAYIDMKDVERATLDDNNCSGDFFAYYPSLPR